MFIQQDSVVKCTAHIWLSVVRQTAQSCLDLLDLLETKILRHKDVAVARNSLQEEICSVLDLCDADI